MKNAAFYTFLLFLAVICNAQFVENVQPFQPMSEGVPCWGDYDGDGDLDLHVTGYNSMSYWKIYKNNSGTFSDLLLSLVPARYSFSSWCDWDNDGDLDGVTTGWGGGIITKLWRNNGNNAFVLAGDLAGVNSGSMAWGDYDNDGDEDLLLNGWYSAGSATISRIYRNDKGTFVDIGAGLQGVQYSASSWCDWDNDGDLDILYTGNTGSVNYAGSYRNDSGAFTYVNLGLPGNNSGSISWGDYDADGDPDLFLTGHNGTSGLAKIYINNGGSFTVSSSSFVSLWSGNADWGDFDADGDLDIILNGTNATTKYTLIYRNTGGVFTLTADVLPGISSGAAKWGDYDHDGDLDLVIMGASSTGNITKIFRNDYNNYNQPPRETDNLSLSETDGKYLKFSFNAASDNPDPVASLTYSLGIDSLDGKSDVKTVHANSSGIRSIPVHGNLGYNLSWKYNKVYLPQETVYAAWKVQAVDLGFSGSGFAYSSGTYQFHDISLTNSESLNKTDSLYIENVYADSITNYTIQVDDDVNFMSPFEQTVDKSKSAKAGFISKALDEFSFFSSLIKGYGYYWRVRPNYSNINRISDFSQVPGYFILMPDFTEIASSLEGVVNSSVKFGDYDNDGDLDILLTGTNGSSVRVSKIYRNDAGIFTDISASLEGLHSGSTAWGDYDNDGDLDILLTGTNGAGQRISKVYRNNAGLFTDISASLEGVHSGSSDWMDYDNDGDLDIFLSGLRDGITPILKVYRNDSGTFSDILTSLEAVYSGSSAWGDYDNDGDLDILLTGSADGLTIISKVYRNDAGVFYETSFSLTAVHNSSVSWGDYDNDGDLDILLSGLPDSLIPISKVYRNAYGTFTDIEASLQGVYSGSNDWGDYDNDGDLDILLTGMNGAGQRISKVYRNSAGVFTDISSSLAGVYGSSAEWGDYDNDGDLDILLAGEGDWAVKISKIYRNNSYDPNIAPLPPTGLNASIAGSDLLISFNAGSDLETPSSGLSYNLGIDVNDENIKPEMSDLTNGYRKIVETGNIGQNHGWTLKNCLAGLLPQARSDVTIKAQSVDHNFTGSIFSTANSSFYGEDLSLVNNSEMYPEDSLFWEAAYSDSINDYTIQVDEDVNFISPYEQTVDKSKSGKAVYITKALDELSFFKSLIKAQTYYWRIRPNYSNPSRISRFSLTPSTFELMPEFSDISSSMLGLAFGSSIWADYDNDGDLDVFVTGQEYLTMQRYSLIYNNNNGVFTDIDAGLIGMNYSYADWGDYDNDGDLDLVMIGDSALDQVILYRNDSSTFTYVNTGISCSGYGTVKWGDKDNDGDLDLLVTGRDGASNEISKIIENMDGTFTETNIGELSPLEWSAGDWADFDNDGDLDIVISGRGSIDNYTYVYLNNGGTFVLSQQLPLTIYRSCLDFGDYDNDGDPDLIIAGYSMMEGYSTKIYSNNNGMFFDSGIVLPGGQDGSVNWGDYDNDGDLDILLTGYSPTVITKIYLNESGNFVEFPVGLKPSNRGRASWGDYDNDGDIDILISGRETTSDYFTKIYRNNIQTPNTVPSPPSNILINTNFSNTTISFTPGADNETPSAGLSYNMELGLNDYSAMPSMSDSTGYRKIVRTGNVGQVNSWTISKEVPEAIIPQEIMNFWCRIQSVDHNFAGSSFAQANRLIPNRDLLIIPRDYMTGTDELVWEFVMSDSVVSYTVQMAVDTIFYPYYGQTLTFAKESKTGYVGVALQDLDFFSSLTDDTEYYWRVKPNHVNPSKQTEYNSQPNSFIFNPSLVPPANITISVSGQYVTLDWDSGKEVKADILYKVYSSNNPFATFPSGWALETSTTSTSYLVLSTAAKKFYCVTANNTLKVISKSNEQR